MSQLLTVKTTSHRGNRALGIGFREINFSIFTVFLKSIKKCVERIRVLIIFIRPMVTLKTMFLNYC